jgi:hypothetical protein
VRNDIIPGNLLIKEYCKGMEIPSEVTSRIDDVLERNKLHEIAIMIMAGGIFILGLVALIYGISTKEVFIVAPATLITAFLYWPIQHLGKIRKENIALAAVPSLISTLPPEEAARELIKLLDKLS